MFYKKPLFYIPAALVLMIVLGIGALLWPNSSTPAVLRVLSGTVDVDTGNGYAAARDGMTLRSEDKIRTGPDSSAAVILYDAVIIRILPDTEITIAALSKERQEVMQQTGTVWTKVARLGGIEQYAVQTPMATATVRGTSLRTTAREKYFELLVAEGTVSAADQNVTTKLVGENGTYRKEEITAEDKKAILEELQFELQTLRELRLHEIHKNKAAVAFAKRTFGTTDDGIASFFIDIDEGRHSEDEIRSNAPVMVPSMKVIFAYDAEIKKTLQLMEKK